MASKMDEILFFAIQKLGFSELKIQFENQTIWQSLFVLPFKIWTSLDFRSPVYIKHNFDVNKNKNISVCCMALFLLFFTGPLNSRAMEVN